MRTTVIRRILEYAVVFCIILEFNTPYLIFPVVNRMIRIFPAIILVCLILMSNYSIRKKINGWLFVYWVGSLIPMFVIDEHGSVIYIFRYVIILPLLWLYLSLRKEIGYKSYLSLFFCFSNMMVILACISLAMWLLGSILQIFPPTGLFPYDWDPIASFIPTYWGIYFETQSVAPWGEFFYRNSGIFTEGPMHNMPLCVAFCIEYFLRPVRSKVRLSILAITILTTFTTTGQLFLLLILGLHLYKTSRGKLRTAIIVLAPLLLFGGYMATTTLIENKKMTKGGEGSVESRKEDITYCIEAGIKHPVLGVGLVEDGKSEFLWKGKKLGRSNSLFAVFARGGIYVLVLYLGALFFIPYRYYKKTKSANWFLTMLFFLFLFTITISFIKYLTLLFIAWGLSNIGLRKWDVCKV